MSIQDACGFCKNTTGFYAERNAPRGAKYDICLIRCDNCKAVVAAVDFISTSDIYEQLQRIEKQ